MLEDAGHAVTPERRGPGSGVTWGITDLVVGFVAVFVFFFLLAIVIVLPVQAATSEEAPETLAAQAVAVAVWDAVMVLIVYYLVRRRGAAWPALGLKSPLPRENGTQRTVGGIAGLAALLYFVSIMCVNAYGVAIDKLGLDELKPSEQLTETFFEHDWLAVMIGVSVVFGAPFAEEVFFRGFLFGGLRRRLPFVAAALLSGALFSLAHADPGLILPFTIVGFILAFAYERTGSLYTSISVHFIFNAVSFLYLAFVPEARPG
jgi:membrane protease YdiL (CAAX protease family)